MKACVLFLAPLLLVPAASSGQVHTVTVDASQTFQRMEGFGTCVYPHGDAPAFYRTDDFPRYYVTEIGLNMLRVNIAYFDHPEVEDPGDISASRIDLGNKGHVYIDAARALQEADPDLRVVATVWTPPTWMKVSGATGNGLGRGNNSAITATSYHNRKLGRKDPNRVKEDHYAHFAAWMAAVADYWEEQGIPLYAISPGNEIRFSQWYVSCVWTAEDFAEMLPQLRETLDRAGHEDLIIFGPETMTHNTHDAGTGGYLKAIMNDSEARRALGRIASHGYEDGVVEDMSRNSSLRLWELIEDYDKAYWMTEGGSGKHDWPHPFEQGLAVGLHNALVAGHASAFLPWQINGGKASTHNIMVGGKPTHKTAAFSHFARAVPVEGHRIAAEPAFGDVLASAYHHGETGALGVVLVNTRDEPQEVRVRFDELDGLGDLEVYRSSRDERFARLEPVRPELGSVAMTLPPHSAVSLMGEAGGGNGNVALTAPLAPARVWTSVDGAEIEAALVSVHEEGVVLRLADGRETPVRYERLSEADRNWVATLE